MAALQALHRENGRFICKAGGLLTRYTLFMTYALMLNDELISDEKAPALVPWWSFTKTVIAFAVLMLVRDEVLSLDACCPGKPYTLRQLLQHEAGLADYGAFPEYHSSVKAGMPPWTVDEMLARVDKLKTASAPGIRWSYSNVGSLHVRPLIEQALNEKLDSVLDRLIFRPLNLWNARVANLPSDFSDVIMGDAHGYHPRMGLSRTRGGAINGGNRVVEGANERCADTGQSAQRNASGTHIRWPHSRPTVDVPRVWNWRNGRQNG